MTPVAARLPFFVGERAVGTVAQAHLPALRAQGLIRAWRDERFALFDPVTCEVLATMGRAAARFWGTSPLPCPPRHPPMAC